MDRTEQPQSTSASPSRLVWRIAVPSSWLGIAIGVELLAAGPPTLAWLWLWVAVDRSSPAIVGMLAWHWLGLTLPWTLLAICATLNWRPFWQRCLVFAPPCALVASAGWLLNSVMSEHRGWETPLGALPLLVLAATAPTFLMRVARRWTLAPPNIKVKPRAASIATLLLATTLCAIAAAWLQAFEPPPTEYEFGLILALVSFVLGPSVLIGAVLLVTLRVSMLERNGPAWLAGTATAIAALVVLPSLATFLALISARMNGNTIETGQLIEIALSAAIFTTLALAISFATFVWLRLLGYRLLTIRDSQ